MKNKFLFSASLRITHPTIAAKDIVEALPLKANVVHSIGEPRKTKRGAALQGGYQKTYVSFPLSVDGFDYPENFLLKQVGEPYLSNDAYFESIALTGGKIEFFMGIHCKNNGGFDIDCDLVRKLAKKWISISFDIYGNEWV
ncbi:hypothetical protein ISP15_08190 [Dyella jejuensis]|uniref:Uncharacterized protein n=1 Tax=Dyella jejuensis TaxID=1432009 RepID=A0ABW8JJ96_9GAMM